MKTNFNFTAASLALVASIGLAGCAGMSNRDQNTAIGAGAGAVGGAILTGAAFALSLWMRQYPLLTEAKA